LGPARWWTQPRSGGAWSAGRTRTAPNPGSVARYRLPGALDILVGGSAVPGTRYRRYGNPEAAALLLDRGAPVDAQAAVDDSGAGGQTPIFRSVTQFRAWGRR